MTMMECWMKMIKKEKDKTNEVALQRIIKNDIMTKGLKIGFPAVEHLNFLLDNHHHPEAGELNAIRFYCMGYVAGVQSEHYDNEVKSD